MGSRERACGGEETSTLGGTEEYRGVNGQEEDDDKNSGNEDQWTEVYRDAEEQTEDGGRMDDEDPETETDGDSQGIWDHTPHHAAVDNVDVIIFLGGHME